MGVGYDRPIVQWSKGEYAHASNTEDDFSVMESNGLSLVPDDYADSSTGAVVLPTPTFAVTGLIGTASDVDVFAINVGDGPASISVTPTSVSPNLDARLELRDSSFALVAADDPASAYSTEDAATGLSASIATTLTAGRYYVVVDGVGAGDPLTTGYTDYDSLGRYELDGSVTAPTAAVPAAPTGLVATPGNGHAQLSWTPADDGGSAITDYTVSVTAYGGAPAAGVTGATTRNVGSAASSFDFTGLRNGVTYEFTVAAINFIGSGTSSASASVTPDGVAPTAALSAPSPIWSLGTSWSVAWSGSTRARASPTTTSIAGAAPSLNSCRRGSVGRARRPTRRARSPLRTARRIASVFGPETTRPTSVATRRCVAPRCRWSPASSGTRVGGRF